MILIDKDTNKDAIVAYLKDPNGDHDKLSTKQKELLQYYTDAYAMIRNYNSVSDAIQVLVKFSKHRGDQISISTARRYIYDAQDVFGYVSKTTPEAIKHLVTEIYKDAIAMARDQNDPKTMIYGAEKLMAAAGEEKEQPFNADMLEPHIYEIGLDPKALKLLQMLTQKGPIDLDALMGNAMQGMAVDAEIVE